eukprot:6214246-Pleurochrysis_carterae.AAC.2
MGTSPPEPDACEISCATVAMASDSATASSACTRALRLSAVSVASTGQRFCTTVGPASTWSSTKWTVHPDSGTLAASTAECTSRSIPPAKAGSSDGCTLSARRRQRAQKEGESMRIQPTSSTSCTPSASRRAVSSAS